MKNDVITMVYENSTQDADGFPVVTRETEELFCEIQSVKRAEYYAAASANVKVSLVAVLNYADYECFIANHGKPTIITFEGDDYNIIRIWRKGKRKDVELTLSEVE